MSLVQNKGILFACFIPYSYGQEKIMPEEEGGEGKQNRTLKLGYYCHLVYDALVPGREQECETPQAEIAEVRVRDESTSPKKYPPS